MVFVYMYTIYIFVNKSLQIVDKGMRKNIKKKKKEMEKLENINGSTEYEIEKVK